MDIVLHSFKILDLFFKSLLIFAQKCQSSYILINGAVLHSFLLKLRASVMHLQVSSTFQPFCFYAFFHFAFMRDLHRFLFLLREQNPKIFTSLPPPKKMKNKSKIQHLFCREPLQRQSIPKQEWCRPASSLDNTLSSQL